MIFFKKEEILKQYLHWKKNPELKALRKYYQKESLEMKTEKLQQQKFKIRTKDES